MQTCVRFHSLFAAACVAIMVGCGGPKKGPDYKGKLVPVQGVVKVNGVAVAGVQIAFVPRAGIGGNQNEATVGLASGTTDHEGKYTLFTPPGGVTSTSELKNYAGVLPGKYSVTFTHWVMPDGTPWAADPNHKQGPAVMGAIEKLPPRLGNPTTTPHLVEIKEGGNSAMNFDLTTK